MLYNATKVLLLEYLKCQNKRIIQPLLAQRIPSDPKPSVLYFIDACQGLERLKSGPDQSKSDDDLVKGLVEQETNFHLEYATVDHHVSYATSKASRWLPVVAHEIGNERKTSLQNIMAVVKEKVWKYSPNKQQAQSLDRLHCGELYLHPGCDK